MKQNEIDPLVTVRKVAEAANVSLGTVSRVLNGSSTVSPEIAGRVNEAMARLNYRRLRQRRAARSPARPLDGRAVGVVLLGLSEGLAALPAVAAALHGVEEAASAAGAGVRLVNCPAVEPAHPVRDRFDGLIVKGAMQGDLAAAVGPRLREVLAAAPVVWVLGRPAGMAGDAVGAHEWAVGRLAAEHLTARGHKRLGFLNPRADHDQFRQRAASFADHAARRGAEVTSFLGGDLTGRPFPLPAVQGVEAVQKLLDDVLAARPRPTALFVPADNITALVYRAMAARGLVPGRDLSLISCNHERPLTAALFPSLTTIDIRPEEVGRRAVQQLAARLAGAAGAAVEIQVEPELVEGASVAAAPTRRGG